MTKVTTLSEAVASIPQGAHVALSGFATARCAMAFAHEVIRQDLKELTVSQCVGAMDADILAGAGVLSRIIYGGGSRGRTGQHFCLNRAIEQGTIIAEEYSSLSMAFRYLAGSLGLPFIPIRSLQGSDILKHVQEVAPDTTGTITDPFTGDDWLVLKPLSPDVAVVQVQVADEEGNAQILGPRWENEEQVKASKRTIVITERLVSTEMIRREPDRTLVSGFRVSHVVQLPFAAHPSSVFQAYDFDEAHIDLYAKASKTAEGFQTYLDQYVYGVKDHWEYLEKVGGMQHLNSLIADPLLGY
ncbi:MAG TPA: 3-oxoadipate--succinyl-CoA transferase subunit A [Chloroflexi bacterium]|nr:3-oxoadipate--succinyl-CoA transferase subunit A [Chloroflexota bacterium]